MKSGTIPGWQSRWMEHSPLQQVKRLWPWTENLKGLTRVCKGLAASRNRLV